MAPVYELMRICLHILLVACVTLLSAEVSAQSTGTVAGTVTEYDGRPLPGAQVIVQAMNWHDWSKTTFLAGTVTDENGRYLLTGIPVGTWTLVTAYPGYNSTYVLDVTISSRRTSTVDMVSEVCPPLAVVWEAPLLPRLPFTSVFYSGNLVEGDIGTRR
ncbi:MAG: hypothetical protein Rubg2KO_08150 [Rubricoccaceae bacterium]